MENLIINSPLDGRLIELAEVNDKIYSSGAAYQLKILPEKSSRPSQVR